MNNKLAVPAQHTLATVLHLEQRALRAPSVAALGFVVANETLSLLTYRQAAVFNLSANGNYQLMTASGLASVTEDSPFVVWLTRFSQTFQKVEGSHRLDFSEAPADFAEGWQEWLPDSLLTAALHGPDGQCVGLIMYARETPWQDSEVELLDRLHLTQGYCFWALTARQQGLGKQMSRWLGTRSKWIGAAVLAALFIPVRLSALAPAEVVALDAMAVSAPQDGIVGTVNVMPNTAVKAGDVLFSLVDTTLASRRDIAVKTLSIARAEALVAEQRAFDDLKSKGDVAAAMGRVKEKEAELAATDALLGRINVRAERDGIAVFSDPNDWLGRPVQTGERVMQLADPGRTGVMVWLAAADALNLDAGAPIRLFLHTQPLAPLGAVLFQTSYQATPSPEGVAAYRLYGRFDEGTAAQRIGLRGTARVSGDWAVLGYYILRRPIAAAREWTGL